MVKSAVDAEGDEVGLWILKVVSHFTRNQLKEGTSAFIEGLLLCGYFPAVGIIVYERSKGYELKFFYRRSVTAIAQITCHTDQVDVDSRNFVEIFHKSPIGEICRDHGIISYFPLSVPEGGPGYVIGFCNDVKMSRLQLNVLHVFTLVALFGTLQNVDADYFNIDEPKEMSGGSLQVPERQDRKSLAGIVSRSDAFNKVLEKVELVAPTDATVLITGESGTGKELIARAVQQWSRRSDQPWIKLNCAALPPSLIESELFGHEKGAFTGATAQKKGRFEIAHQGTIFLDEIGELPLDLQTKLLRVLQEGEFERVGGTKTVVVDVRIVAATNRDLRDLIERKLFREDLFYRLNVFPIHSPPLKERVEDIPFLVDHFIKKYNQRFNKYVTSVPTTAMEALELYHWPGNVRELENVIERALISSSSSELDLTDWVGARTRSLAGKPEKKTLQQVEVEYITSVLREANWRIRGKGGAASILDIKPTTLEARIRKLGIRKKIS